MIADPFLRISRHVEISGHGWEIWSRSCGPPRHLPMAEPLGVARPLCDSPYMGYSSIFSLYFSHIKNSCIVTRFPLHIQRMQRHLPMLWYFFTISP
jgi:hypothetical protein